MEYCNLLLCCPIAVTVATLVPFAEFSETVALVGILSKAGARQLLLLIVMARLALELNGGLPRSLTVTTTEMFDMTFSSENQEEIASVDVDLEPSRVDVSRHQTEFQSGVVVAVVRIMHGYDRYSASNCGIFWQEDAVK